MRFYYDTEDPKSLFVESSENEETYVQNLETASYALAALAAEYITSYFTEEVHSDIEDILLKNLSDNLDIFLKLLPGIHKHGQKIFNDLIEACKNVSELNEADKDEVLLRLSQLIHPQ